MTTPSGQISLSNVNTELGYSATATISMNDAAVRTLAGVSSGQISMSNLQNKSNTIPMFFANSTGAPYVHAWPITSSGFGTKLANPGTAATATNARPAAKNGVFITPSNAGVLQGYTYTATAWGTKYANSTAYFGGGFTNVTQFTPTGLTIGIARTTSPGIQLFPFNNSTGFGTPYATYSNLNLSGTTIPGVPDFAFYPTTGSTTYVACITTGWNNFQMLRYNEGSGWGTPFSQLETPEMAQNGGGVTWGSGTGLITSKSSTNYTQSVTFNPGASTGYNTPASGWGTRTLEGYAGFATAYQSQLPLGSSNNTVLATYYSSSYPLYAAYAGQTALAQPASVFTSSPNQVGFNASGTVVCIMRASNDFYVYPYVTNSGFGTRMTNPTLPTGMNGFAMV